jgi:hypothetical protein
MTFAWWKEKENFDNGTSAYVHPTMNPVDHSKRKPNPNNPDLTSFLDAVQKHPSVENRA